MMTQLFAGHAGLARRAVPLFLAFAVGALLTTLLVPASEPDYQTQSYVARIKSLEAQIAGRDKTLKEIARRERKLSLLMKSAEKNSVALEIDIAEISKKTGHAQKTAGAFKNRKKENEPIFPDNPDDSDLLNRLDRLLAGMGVRKGKAG